MPTADDVVDALLRPACPLRLHHSRFSALDVDQVHSAVQVDRDRRRLSRGEEDYGTPSAAPQQSREGDRSADAKKGALPRRAWLYRVVAGFRNVLTGIWLWTCLKTCGRPPSGDLDSSKFKFLEATNAVATGLSLLSSTSMVPGTVTVMVLSSPGLGGPARSPIWLLRLRRRGTRPPRP